MDKQVSIPNSVPVEWIVILEGVKKDLPISERNAELNGLYTEERWAEMQKEKDEEEEKIEAESSSIGHVKLETKKVAKKKKSRKSRE